MYPTANDTALEFLVARSPRTKPKKLSKPPADLDETSVVTKASKGNAFARTRTRLRSDLGCVVRSGWEATTLRLLKALDIGYEYEPYVFTYPIKRGIKGYCPDIKLHTGEWIEIKGYFDKASYTKLKRFKIYYPEEFAVLTMIISKHNKTGLLAATTLGVPNILYWEDIRRLANIYVGTWA